MQMNSAKYNFSTLVMLRLQYSLLQTGDVYDIPNIGHWDNLSVNVDQHILFHFVSRIQHF